MNDEMNGKQMLTIPDFLRQPRVAVEGRVFICLPTTDHGFVYLARGGPDGIQWVTDHQQAYQWRSRQARNFIARCRERMPDVFTARKVPPT